jgi:hypothetical protein
MGRRERYRVLGYNWENRVNLKSPEECGFSWVIAIRRS